MRRILFLRGVNIGGVKLPMAAFRAMLNDLGLQNVRSYIQSGNAVFDDPGLPDLRAAISGALATNFGLSSALFLYDPPGFDAVIAACPFAAQGALDGATVHVFFLADPAAPDLAALDALATTEQFHLTPQALYLYAPDGIGRSVLAEKLPRHLKVAHSARNWNTVQAVAALARA